MLVQGTQIGPVGRPQDFCTSADDSSRKHTLEKFRAAISIMKRSSSCWKKYFRCVEYDSTFTHTFSLRRDRYFSLFMDEPGTSETRGRIFPSTPA